MAKLSLNKAAKAAGVAKSTILERLNHNDPALKMSAEKNARGHWEIDTSELFRCFPAPSSEQSRELVPTTEGDLEKTNQLSALEVEVKMLREKIADMDLERERERENLTKTIENMREDHRQTLAVISDQRPQRGLFGLFRKAG